MLGVDAYSHNSEETLINALHNLSINNQEDEVMATAKEDNTMMPLRNDDDTMSVETDSDMPDLVVTGRSE